MTRLAKLIAMPARDRGVVVRGWFWLLFVDLALRCVSLTRVQSLVRSKLRPSVPGDRAGEALRLAELVGRVAHHHLYPMTCLRRALVLQRFLAQSGIVGELRFGVRKEEGELEAHAWIEIDGEAVGEPQDLEERYQALSGPEQGNLDWSRPA